MGGGGYKNPQGLEINTTAIYETYFYEKLT